jgi:site-specific DNA-methyltransferase (adenine-specific)
MTKIISGVRPFGIPTKIRPEKKGDLILVSSGGQGPFNSENISSGQELVNKWKVMTSKTSHDHAGQSDNKGKRRVLSRVEILPPKYVCTESYIILGAFDAKKEAKNCLSYVCTLFVRFLISLLSFSQDITRERFVFVPMQDFSEPWTDEKLYKKYSLTKNEIAFIESMIRPMEVGEED